jgi:ribosomal protein S18 acetylase RimI-like enzyme
LQCNKHFDIKRIKVKQNLCTSRQFRQKQQGSGVRGQGSGIRGQGSGVRNQGSGDREITGGKAAACSSGLLTFVFCLLARVGISAGYNPKWKKNLSRRSTAACRFLPRQTACWTSAAQSNIVHNGCPYLENAMNSIHITKAEYEDLKEILELQSLAYQSEALIHNDFSIQPLTQTLDELAHEHGKGIILKAVAKNRIVGSVRAYAENETIFIGKLMVHPAYQNQGLGKRLLQAMENEFPQPRCELFTSRKSEKNLRLYEKCGYTRYKEVTLPSGIIFVYLEKYRP